MDLDATALARIQFAFSIAFHTLWPAYRIGIASFIVALRPKWFGTKEDIWRAQIKFWAGIFALGFGAGAASRKVGQGDLLSFRRETGAFNTGNLGW